MATASTTTLAIPSWFSQLHTGGRRLAMGFGGPFSGIAGCSAGPSLHAINPPSPNNITTPLATTMLVDYQFHEPPDVTRYCHRNTDYFRDPNNPEPWDSDPINGVGFWTGVDYIFGGGCWIDTATKSGVLVMVNQAHGAVRYIPGGSSSDSSQPWACLLNPYDLAAVPLSWLNTELTQYNPASSSVFCGANGLVWDPVDSLLYVLDAYAYSDAYANRYPAVHVYHIAP